MFLNMGIKSRKEVKIDIQKRERLGLEYPIFKADLGSGRIGCEQFLLQIAFKVREPDMN